jgi:hypothetical protein
MVSGTQTQTGMNVAQNQQQPGQNQVINGTTQKQVQAQPSKSGVLQSVVLIDTENNAFYEINKDLFLSVGTKTTTFPPGKDGTKVALKVNGLTTQTQPINGGAGQQAGNFPIG